MKVLGTDTFVSNKVFEKIKERGYTGTSHQFRIICKCRGIADANKKCSILGIGDKIFTRAYTSETGNTVELELCETEDIWFRIGRICKRENYISAKELYS